MTRSALVIHSDERQLRFACDALVMFRPGFRVSTASSLSTAGEWLEALTPDLVILEAAITDPETLCAWARDHELDARRTVIYGHGASRVGDLGAASVREPVRLPDLLSTVRRIADHSTSVGAHASRMRPVQEGY